MNKPSSGFTLVELVISIILIAILSLYAIPKLLSGGYAEISLRQELIAQLQLVQTQNMQHRTQAYCLQINADHYYSGRYLADSCRLQGDISVINDPLSVTPGVLVFDGMGRVRLSDSSLCSALPCSIQISGRSSVLITIEAEGYIHEA